MIFLKFLMKNLPKMSYKDFSIGLTGGIGSGKTMVANLFAEQGANIAVSYPHLDVYKSKVVWSRPPNNSPISGRLF